MTTLPKKTAAIVTVIGFVCLIAFLPFGSSQANSEAVAFDAAATYKTKCASCHGLDGSGNTAYGKKEKLRDLRSAEVQGQSDAQLLQIIAKGKGKMPGFEKSLDADTCKQLVAVVRSLKR
jgi:cytochrome c6